MIYSINIFFIISIISVAFLVLTMYLKLPLPINKIKLQKLKADLLTEMNHDESYYLNKYTQENANSQIAYKSSKNNIYTAVQIIDATLEIYTIFMGILNQMYDIAMDASNDTLTNSKRIIIEKKFKPLIDEIDRLSCQAEFNGIKVVNGTAGDGKGNILFHVLPKKYSFKDVINQYKSSEKKINHDDFVYQNEDLNLVHVNSTDNDKSMDNYIFSDEKTIFSSVYSNDSYIIFMHNS